MTTYKDAGVDVAAGDDAVRRIRDMVAETWGFGGGVVVPSSGFVGTLIKNADGTLDAMSTDTAGTKTIVASLMGIHDTIGQDAVAMVVNDLAAGGLTPRFGINCILMGKQIPARTTSIMTGIVEGCRLARCALVGGEMAEVPGLIKPEHYEVATAFVGSARTELDVITGDGISPGMGIFGYPSSGVHSNGFSLIRKIFDLRYESSHGRRQVRHILETIRPDLGSSLGEELLIPTRIYVDTIAQVRKTHRIVGLAHITGGGICGKVARVIPKFCDVRIDAQSWTPPPIFQMIAHEGKIDWHEMHHTFNCGMGMIAISPDDLTGAGFVHIGEVTLGIGVVEIQ
ncbi:MAG: phosphoribosylformylglycinamidine cyclo-ligase [Patescibacteria group bacterium]